MSYCTTTEIYAVVNEQKLKQMFGIQDGGKFPEDRVQNYIDATERKMNAFLGGVYKLPIVGVKSIEILKGISFSLSVEALYTHGMEGTVPERITKDGADAMSLLKRYCRDSIASPLTLPDSPLVNSVQVNSPDALKYAGL